MDRSATSTFVGKPRRRIRIAGMDGSRDQRANACPKEPTSNSAEGAKPDSESDASSRFVTRIAIAPGMQESTSDHAREGADHGAGRRTNSDVVRTSRGIGIGFNDKRTLKRSGGRHGCAVISRPSDRQARILRGRRCGRDNEDEHQREPARTHVGTWRQLERGLEDNRELLSIDVAARVASGRFSAHGHVELPGSEARRRNRESILAGWARYVTDCLRVACCRL